MNPQDGDRIMELIAKIRHHAEAAGRLKVLTSEEEAEADRMMGGILSILKGDNAEGKAK